MFYALILREDRMPSYRSIYMVTYQEGCCSRFPEIIINSLGPIISIKLKKFLKDFLYLYSKTLYWSISLRMLG